MQISTEEYINSGKRETDDVLGNAKFNANQKYGNYGITPLMKLTVQAQITWMKRKNRRLLTVGKSTHSVDKRFVVIHSSIDWLLQIRAVTVQDEGIYECQITSHPVQRNFVRLKITEAYSIIPGAPDLHVKQGSSLRLECQLKAAAESPLYVFWYRQGHMINYDEELGVKVELTKNGSILMVNKTKPSHGGNYTCTPSNAKPAYVMVHVIEGCRYSGDRCARDQTTITTTTTTTTTNTETKFEANEEDRRCKKETNLVSSEVLASCVRLGVELV
ncbi:Peroxidasin [Apis cerana cerana]|uniref:Peroxidasin n=1 Tax=Apis cerana cerana TaxID=94128 RepID=A0A2A3EQQ3_APICC|nr:Peroxidasin [Apis cerana cerana]